MASFDFCRITPGSLTPRDDSDAATAPVEPETEETKARAPPPAPYTPKGPAPPPWQRFDVDYARFDRLDEDSPDPPPPDEAALSWHQTSKNAVVRVTLPTAVEEYLLHKLQVTFSSTSFKIDVPDQSLELGHPEVASPARREITFWGVGVFPWRRGVADGVAATTPRPRGHG